MYAVKNISTNRKLVCTLSDGSTLRLYPGQKVELKDNQVTRYLENLSKSSSRVVTLEHKQSNTKAEKKSKKPVEEVPETEENKEE